MAVTEKKSTDSSRHLAQGSKQSPTPQRSKLLRAVQSGFLFLLATFVMVGYQNCAGQTVDLSSATPGASNTAACAPSTSQLSGFSGANTDIQNVCVACHADLSNPASSTFRLYSTASGDTGTATENFCSIQTMTPATVYSTITASTVHPIRANTTTEPNLLAYLQSM